MVINNNIDIDKMLKCSILFSKKGVISILVPKAWKAYDKFVWGLIKLWSYMTAIVETSIKTVRGSN